MSKEEFNLEDCIALKTYDLISQKLQNQNLKESQGILSAVTMFQNMVYIGTSLGTIRCFNLNNQFEYDALTNQNLRGNKVTAIDVSRH